MPLLLHPGFHKTGTTVLESRVLPALGARYLGRHYGSGEAFDPEFGGRIEDVLAQVARGEDCEAALADLIAELAARPERSALASEALLCPAGFEGVLGAIRRAAKQLADPAALFVLVSVRRQSDLIVSRYLHDLNTKLPALLSERPLARLRHWLRSRPPYPLEAALDPAAAPCAWPACLPRGAACSCRARGGRVPIRLDLYDFHRAFRELREALPAERVALVDLVDPALRGRGAQRLAGLLSEFGESWSAERIEAAFARPLNSQAQRRRGLAGSRDFRRESLDPAALAGLRARLDSHYRDSNRALADALPEFAAYLEPLAPEPLA